MPFPKRYAELAARLRVPAGFVVLVVSVILARPTPGTLALGLPIAVLGLGLRAWAAGHLRKNESLATTGPFAHMRNPLYLGTLLVAAGMAVVSAHPGVPLLLAAFLLFFYLPVVEEEENHLRRLFPEYAAYASAVPRFLPKLRPDSPQRGRFKFAYYRRNREAEAAAGFLAVIALLAFKLFFF